jgi:hypothetical protein
MLLWPLLILGFTSPQILDREPPNSTALCLPHRTKYCWPQYNYSDSAHAQCFGRGVVGHSQYSHASVLLRMLVKHWHALYAATDFKHFSTYSGKDLYRTFSLCTQHMMTGANTETISPITFSSPICEAEGCFKVFLRLGDPDGLAGGMDTGRDGLALAGLLRSFTSIIKKNPHTCTWI